MKADFAKTVRIKNRRGLHARAAAKLVKTVQKFEAEVTLTKDGATVGADSIMGLLMLAASQGSEVKIAATGPDAAAALAEIETLIGQKFDEDQ